MASEITLNFGLRVVKGFLSHVIAPFSKKVNLAGTRLVANVQAIGFAAHEALVVGDLSTAGYIYAINTDATNFVQIGVDVSATFYPIAKLLPGQAMLFPAAVLTLYAKADTGAVNLQYVFLER